MNASIIIRTEIDSDVDTITEVTVAALWDTRITIRKFGFENPPSLELEGVPAEIFFALSFNGRTPEGTVAFHEAFKADGQRR